MMKTISVVISVLALSLTSVSFAQTSQTQPGDTIVVHSTPDPLVPLSSSLRGATLLLASGSFSYTRQKVADWGWGESYSQTTLLYGFDVRFDRMLLDHFALGCALSFLEMSSSISGSRYSDGHTSAGLMGIGPRLGYYWGNRNSRVLPFVAGEFDLLAAMGSGAGSGSSSYQVGGGVIYQPKPRVGISFELNYVGYSNQHDVTNIVGQAGLVAFIY